MNDKIIELINSITGDIHQQYNKLILLVGESVGDKSKLLKTIASNFNTNALNINLLLSKKLIDISPKQRVLKFKQFVEDIFPTNEKVIILDKTEIMFDQNLKQDPLRILLSLSRTNIIIASWTGRYENKKLIYADTNHPEYRKYDVKDFVIITLDGDTNYEFND